MIDIEVDAQTQQRMLPPKPLLRRMTSQGDLMGGLMNAGLASGVGGVGGIYSPEATPPETKADLDIRLENLRLRWRTRHQIDQIDNSTSSSKEDSRSSAESVFLEFSCFNKLQQQQSFSPLKSAVVKPVPVRASSFTTAPTPPPPLTCFRSFSEQRLKSMPCLQQRKTIVSSSVTEIRKKSTSEPTSGRASVAECTDIRAKSAKYGILKNTSVYQVLEFLYVGNFDAASDNNLLCQLNVEYIVDLTDPSSTSSSQRLKKSLPCQCKQQQRHCRSTLSLQLVECPLEDLFCQFDEVNRFIEKARLNRKSILIFDQQNLLFCTVLAVQFIMQYYRMGFITSRAFLTNSCPRVALTAFFENALARLETRQPKENTPSNYRNVHSAKLFENTVGETITATPVPPTAGEKSTSPTTKVAWI